MPTAILRKSRATVLLARCKEHGGTIRLDEYTAAAWGWTLADLTDAAITLMVDRLATLESDGSGAPLLVVLTGGK